MSNLFLLNSRIFGFHLRHQTSKTKELSIILSVYFHDVLKQVKTNIYTKFHSQRALRFVIQCVWISKLLCDATFTWRPKDLSCRRVWMEWQLWRLTIIFSSFDGWRLILELLADDWRLFSGNLVHDKSLSKYWRL